MMTKNIAKMSIITNNINKSVLTFIAIMMIMMVMISTQVVKMRKMVMIGIMRVIMTRVEIQ